jgi:hypothetical protein
LVDEVVAPAAAAAASAALLDFWESAERVGKYLARLQEVQQRRIDMEVCHKRGFWLTRQITLPAFVSWLATPALHKTGIDAQDLQEWTLGVDREAPG